MRILDENNAELTAPDLDLGYLKKERILIAHHPAVPGVPEQWHYETIAEYPGGGKDVARVVDVPGTAPREAWDEYEDILRYTPYTQEELEQIEKEKNMQTMEERVEELETNSAEIRKALEMILQGVTE